MRRPEEGDPVPALTLAGVEQDAVHATPGVGDLPAGAEQVLPGPPGLEEMIGGPVQVGLAHQFLVHVVIDHGKPAVQVAVEEGRQHIEQGKSVFQQWVGE